MAGKKSGTDVKNYLEFMKYQELVEFIKEYPNHKKHLILMGDEGVKFAKGIAMELSRLYRYPPIPAWAIQKLVNSRINHGPDFGTRPPIPEIINGSECLQYGRCVIVKNINEEPSDNLSALVLQLINSEIIIIGILKSAKFRSDLPSVFLDLCEVFDLEEGKMVNKPKPSNETTVEGEALQFTHSDDYSSVCINGKKHALAPNEAEVIEMLHNTNNDAPYLRQTHILKQLDLGSTTTLKEVFQSNEAAYKDLIASDSKKGLVRLNIDLPIKAK